MRAAAAMLLAGSSVISVSAWVDMIGRTLADNRGKAFRQRDPGGSLRPAQARLPSAIRRQ